MVMRKSNKIIAIPCKIGIEFFGMWLDIMRPYHKLTDKEIVLMSYILKKRYELRKIISDDIMLEKVLFNEDTKRKIRNECNISSAHFQVIISKLRKSKVILDCLSVDESGKQKNELKVNPKYVPEISSTDDGFGVTFYFKFDEDR